MPPIANRSLMGVIYASAFILTTICFFFLIVNFSFFDQILNFSFLFTDYTKEAKVEITRSHFILEDIITNKNHEEIDRARHYLDVADRNIHALISSNENIFTRLNLFNGKKFQKDLIKICSDLNQLMKRSTRKIIRFAAADKKSSNAKEDFDIFFFNIIDQLNDIEKRFQSVLKAGFYGIRRTQYLLIAVLLFTILSTALYTRANFKYHRNVEKKLTKKSEFFFSDMKEKEAKLKSILKLAPVGIGITKNERFIQINDHMEMMSGYTKEELEGQNSQLLYASSGEFNRVQKIKHEQMRSSGNAVIETLWRCKNGSIINVLYNSTPQHKGDMEKEIIFTALDITPWKKTQIRLKKSEEKFRLLAENTVDCIWLMDLNLTFHYINPSVLHMLGYTAEEWIGSRLEDHFPSQEIELMGAIIEEELLKGANSKGVVFETNIINKQGQLIPVEISSKILFDSLEQPVGLQGTTRDISRRKQAEDEVKRLNQDLERRVARRTAQLNAVNKELESFAYSVSHDLRAPLRSIDGFSKILLEDYSDILDEVGRDYLLRVQHNTDRMGNLIENMLKFSRTMSWDMKKEQVDLSAMAHGIIEELKTQEKDRNVRAVIAPNLVTKGDSHLIRAVLDNLLGNAWKFTSRKNDAARIEFGVRHENGTAVYFVKDNGAGFDMAYSDKLFSVFQRLHTASEFPGSGVGLATVARVIQRHGGRIWAEGKPEQGAVFYFIL